MKVRIPIKNLLTFYDDPPKSVGGHVSSITALIGEDLGTGLLVDYFHAHGYEAKIIPGKVTQGTNKGKRLDRWILVTRGKRSTCYQVEIKNWGASAIGGRKIELNPRSSFLRKHKIERWERQWTGKTFTSESVQKVLTPMRPPLANVVVEPLICYWDAMHPTGGSAPMFSIPLRSGAFSRVWVFSMSSYLRRLLRRGKRVIEFDAPEINARLQLLRGLIGRIDWGKA
jgi:hypothetical protein